MLQQRGGRGGVHAGTGQDPAEILDHIGAGPGALFLLRERDRLLRRARQLELGEDRACCAMRVRGAAGCAVPDRWRDRRQVHAERARELAGPVRVQLRDIQRAALRVARLEVGRLREVREFALGGRAAIALLELRRAGAHIRGDGLAAGGKQPHHLPGDALDLEPVAVITGSPFQAEPGGEGFLQVLGDDRSDRADVLVVTERVRRAPFPVGGGPGDVGDLGVDVQLHVAVPGGVLQPVRHRQVGFVPLAGLPAVHPGVMRTGAGKAGLPLEVLESGVHGLPDHAVDLCDQGGPVLIAVLVAGLSGEAGVLAEGGVEDRDGLGERQGQVEEQGALPGLPGSFDAEFVLAAGGGVRLGSQQAGVQVGGFAAAVGGLAQLGAVGSFALTEEQVIGLALDPLADLQAERLGAGAPPAAGRLSSGFAGLDVVAGRVFGRAAVDLLPDVVKVVALAQRRDDGHRLIPPRPKRQGCPCSSHDAWVWGSDWSCMKGGKTGDQDQKLKRTNVGSHRRCRFLISFVA